MKQFSLIIILLLTSYNIVQAEPWTIHAGFEDGALGQKAERTDDSFYGAAGRSTYTKEQILKGGQAARMEILKDEEGYGMWGGEFIFPHKSYRGETIWFIVHTFMPTGFVHHAVRGGMRLKFMRIHTSNAAGNNMGYNDLYFDMEGDANPLTWIYEGGEDWVDIGGTAEFPKFDVWESYEMAVTLDNVSKDNGGMAEIRVWKNGELLKHITNRYTLSEPDGYSNRALLFTYWNGGAPKTQHMFVDEITLTNIKPSTLDALGNPYIGGVDLGKLPKPPKN